jgi:hypothetical protein
VWGLAVLGPEIQATTTGAALKYPDGNGTVIFTAVDVSLGPVKENEPDAGRET